LYLRIICLAVEKITPYDQVRYAMLSNVIVFLQLLFSGAIALCFFLQLRQSGAAKPQNTRNYQRELDKLKAQRKISLNLPLSEAIRPKNMDEIIGQEDGLKALVAILCSPNPQHVIIYGPPGVGKTCAARAALEAAKKSGVSPFRTDAPFVEVDATTVRFDERSIADPLIGSVHDPIYQGAGALGAAGVPQPKPGAVTRAHGGVLFIDEIGELHPIQLNKLLKVLEDRVVMLDSAYYNPDDPATPAYVHEVFSSGLPADFRLIGATTKPPESISPAIRSRCMEIFFEPLGDDSIRIIAKNAAKKADMTIEKQALSCLVSYCPGGRDSVNMVQSAIGFAMQSGRKQVELSDIMSVIRSGNYSPKYERRIRERPAPGYVNALAVAGPGAGALLWVETDARCGGGKFKVTGIVEEERIGEGGQRQLKRTSQAGCSVENVKTALSNMGIDLLEYDIHVDFPGGIPIDGPSAGIAMALSCYSAIKEIPFDIKTAVTGEISVLGEALPVGGIREKALAAKKAGAKRMLIPLGNERDAKDSGVEGIVFVPFPSLEKAIELMQSPLPEHMQSAEKTEGVLSASSKGDIAEN